MRCSQVQVEAYKQEVTSTAMALEDTERRVAEAEVNASELDT